MDTKPPALAQVVGPWEDPQVNAQILQHLNDGYRIVHMAREKHKITYVKPDDPDYHKKQFQGNSGDEVLTTYLAREKK